MASSVQCWGLLGYLLWPLGASRARAAAWNSPSWVPLGALLGRFGRLLDRPGALLGRPSALLEASWAVLGRSVGPLGPFWSC
eukprot:8971029-Pyramimonas_sp.AAC.1